MPGESANPALPVKDDGNDVNARVLRKRVLFMLLAIHFNQGCETSCLGGCDGLLRRAEVGRGAAADLNRHKRVIDDSDDIEFTHTVPHVLFERAEALGFESSTREALRVQPAARSLSRTCSASSFLQGGFPMLSLILCWPARRGRQEVMLGEDFTHSAVILAMQLGFILVVAKIAGEITERFLHQPAVIGELVAGIIIGPFALGGIELGSFGPFDHIDALFEPSEEGAIIPVSKTLFIFGQVAAIILLLETGLNTDLKAFLRFVPQASLVALGGVVVPFILGAYATVLFGFADSFFSAPALFIGTIMTATSVGITARVLDDLRRLDSPEGVTILGAAVVDDVIGILILTVVVGVSAGSAIEGATDAAAFELSEVAIVGAKAIGFWLVLTVGGIFGAKYIVRAINSLRGEGAAIALVFGIGLLAAAMAEMFGLAMIIGAYSVGLALSQTQLKNQLHEPLKGLYHATVPVFFVVMGMMVNIEAMLDAIGFGLVIVVLAIIGKVAGSGLPALAAGFSRIGAWRVGVGMAPRGEVGLIVAGIGVSQGLIGQDLFGVAILMTIATTLLAPIVLVPAFRNNSPGLRRDQKVETPS